jgi:hypothetical protein
MVFAAALPGATELLANALTVPLRMASCAAGMVTAIVELAFAMMAGKELLVVALLLVHHLMNKCVVAMVLAAAVFAPVRLASAVLTVVVRIALSTNLPTPLVVSLMPLLSALD